MIFSNTNLYDNGRLFLFTMPLFATNAAIALFYIISSFKKFNLTQKSFSFIAFFLLILSVYRFAALSPYQYVYTNYFSTPKFSMGENKFEHDYLYTSYLELMKKISCRYLQRAVYYAPTELRHCCKRYFYQVLYKQYIDLQYLNNKKF